MKDTITIIIFVVLSVMLAPVRALVKLVFRAWVALTDRRVKNMPASKAKEALEKAIASMDWHGYTVSIEEVIPEEVLAKSNAGGIPMEMASMMIGGITVYDKKTVTFYSDCIRHGAAMCIWKTEKALAEQIVRHENRHVQQYTWLEAHGSFDRAMMDEVFSIYGQSVLEKDAYRYQKGSKYEDDLDVVLAKYSARNE